MLITLSYVPTYKFITRCTDIWYDVKKLEINVLLLWVKIKFSNDRFEEKSDIENKWCDDSVQNNDKKILVKYITSLIDRK